MRVTSILLAGLLMACAASPPPPVQHQKVALAEAKPASEKAPPPEPLAAEELELAMKGGFLSFGLGSLRPKLWSEDELIARLPAATKQEISALKRARDAHRKSQRKESQASFAKYECNDCPERAQLARKYVAASKASNKTRDALDKALEHAEKTLARQLRASTATPEIGIALARLHARGPNLNADASHWVRYGEAGSSAAGRDALERAAALAGADQEVGREVRRELLDGLWSKSDVEVARRLIAELGPVAPPEWRAELGFRAALLDALEGNDANAARGFERALADHVPGSSVSRRTLAKAALVAWYRALDFDRALSAAFRAFDEIARPEPPPPAPPPKPVATKPKASKPKAGAKPIEKIAALRQAAEFGMLGLLSTTGPGLDTDGVARLAADSVERLGRDPTGLDGSADGRARILSVLATRAFYRNDTEGARRLAEAARGLGSLDGTRGALNVLELLAFGDDERERAKQIADERANLPHGYFRTWTGVDAEPDERELTKQLSKARGSARADDKEEPEPPAAHNVRSVLRACIEPVRTRLPNATGNGKERRIAVITLRARVFPDGRAEVEAEADRSDDGLKKVLECVRSAGSRVLAHAPSSVIARVRLEEPVRNSSLGMFGSGSFDGAIGGLVGNPIGESGVGGLGLIGRGGGGTGDGIGLGSIGKGAGGGAAGYGTGTGRLGGKKPKQKKKASK